MGGLTWALSGGLFSPLSSPARPLTSSLLQPLAPAPAPLCCYLWGLDGEEGGRSTSSPPCTDWLGGRRGEGQGHCLGGSHRTREEGGLGAGPRQDPLQTQ